MTNRLLKRIKTFWTAYNRANTDRVAGRFEQAAAGRTDLLGRRTPGVGKLEGSVLTTRWVE